LANLDITELAIGDVGEKSTHRPGGSTMIRILPLLLLLAVTGCKRPVDATPDPGRTEASTDFDAGKALFAAITGADSLVLYEGLPHQMFEAEALRREKEGKKTVTLHGHPFYAEALPVTAEDTENLRSLLSDVQSFDKWMGEAKCGGFHPDYLAEWRVGQATYRVLVCFGCKEAKVFGPERDLRCHIQRGAFDGLHKLLKKHHKNRPKEARE
jgi:hypothetical protein